MRRHFNNPYGKVIKRKMCYTHTGATYRYYRLPRRGNTQLFVINLSDQSESHSMPICIKIVTWFKMGKISRAYNLPIFSGKNYQILNYQLPNSHNRIFAMCKTGLNKCPSCVLHPASCVLHFVPAPIRLIMQMFRNRHLICWGPIIGGI